MASISEVRQEFIPSFSHPKTYAQSVHCRVLTNAKKHYDIPYFPSNPIGAPQRHAINITASPFEYICSKTPYSLKIKDILVYYPAAAFLEFVKSVWTVANRILLCLYTILAFNFGTDHLKGLKNNLEVHIEEIYNATWRIIESPFKMIPFVGSFFGYGIESLRALGELTLEAAINFKEKFITSIQSPMRPSRPIKLVETYSLFPLTIPERDSKSFHSQLRSEMILVGAQSYFTKRHMPLAMFDNLANFVNYQAKITTQPIVCLKKSRTLPCKIFNLTLGSTAAAAIELPLSLYYLFLATITLPFALLHSLCTLNATPIEETAMAFCKTIYLTLYHALRIIPLIGHFTGHIALAGRACARIYC